MIDETDLSENEKQNFESFKALSQLIKEQFLKFIEPLKKINTCIKSNEIEDYISKIKETKTTLISFNQPIDMLDYFNILRDYINKIEKICFDNLLNIKAFDFDRDIFNTIIDDFSDSKLDQRLLNDDLHNKIERSIEDYSNIVQKFYAFSENFCSLYNQIYKDQKYNLLYALSIGYDIKQYLATSNPEQKNANILKQYYQNLKNKESTEYKTLPSEKNSTLEDYFAEKQVIYHQSEEELSHNKEIFQCKIPMLIQHSKNFRNDVTTTFDVKMIENFNSHRDTFLKILQNDLKYEHHQTLYDYSNFVICAMIHMNINKLTDNMYSSVKKALNDKILYDNDPLTIDSLKEIINNSCEKDKKADDPV